MKKFIFLCLLQTFSLTLFCQSNYTDEPIQAITKVLRQQENDWSAGDLNGYMQGYWNHDSLKFIGKNGIQYGWKKTLDGYKKSYTDKAEMGSLNFEIVTIEILSQSAAFVIGKWDLKRAKGNLGGYYTLLFKKIEGKWVIVCDHTS